MKIPPLKSQRPLQRKQLRIQLHKESQLVRKESLKVLKQMERFEEAAE